MKFTYLSPLVKGAASVLVDMPNWETAADLETGAKPEATPAVRTKDKTVASFIVV